MLDGLTLGLKTDASGHCNGPLRPSRRKSVSTVGCPGRNRADVSFLGEQREDVSGRGVSYFGQWPPLMTTGNDHVHRP